MKVLTFGEIMLRLKAPGHERFFQSPMLEATFGGGEANVAVSLANYGMDAEFLTILPERYCRRLHPRAALFWRGHKEDRPRRGSYGHLLLGGRRKPTAEQGRL